MNKPHKHAALMLQFAQDAAETETPWDRWEHKSSDGGWTGMSGIPIWYPVLEYRRKSEVRAYVEQYGTEKQKAALK